MSNKESTVATLGGDGHAEIAASATASTGLTPRAAAKATVKSKVDPDAIDENLVKKGFCGRRATITLPAPRDESEQDFVLVLINGEAFQIPRGVPCAVPEEVLDVLDNAVETRYGRDGVGRAVMRHQYQIAR